MSNLESFFYSNFGIIVRWPLVLAVAAVVLAYLLIGTRKAN